MRFIFLLLFVFISQLIYSQSSDRIITNGDTTIVHIKIESIKDRPIIYLSKNKETDFVELKAINADAVLTGNNKYYISVLLPELKEKVWARCFFDGQYKLVQYKQIIYILTSKNIIRLDIIKQKDGLQVSNPRKYIGQMISIFQNQIDFNFAKLYYNSKSLVLPLIKYHQINNLKYKDYNSYYPVVMEKHLTANVSRHLYEKADLQTNTIKVNGNSYGLIGGIRLSIPNFSKRANLMTGLGLSFSRIEAIEVRELIDQKLYFNFLSNRLYLSLPISVGFNVISQPGFIATISSGLKVISGFPINEQFSKETDSGNIVRTQLYTLKNFHLFQTNEFNFSFRTMNKFNFGIQYDIAIPTKSADKQKQIQLNNSFTIFTRLYF